MARKSSGRKDENRPFIFRTCKLDCRKLTDANAERQANEDDLKIVLRKWNENNADACHKQGIIVQTHNGHSIQNWNIAKGALLYEICDHPEQQSTERVRYADERQEQSAFRLRDQSVAIWVEK